MKRLKIEQKLTKESEKFLEDLRIYLFSSGKKSHEIDEITEELEVHLLEAEQKGKPINKIVGNSPKEYMEMIAKEMTIDYSTWIKYICLIIMGSFSLTVFPDLLEGNLSYTVLEIVGQVVIGGIFIASVFSGFKYLSTTTHSNLVQGLVLVCITTLPMILFVGLIFLNKSIVTPTIHLGTTASLIVGVAAALLLIGMSIWAKTLVLVVIGALLTLPDYLLSLTSLSEKTQLLISPWILFGGLGIYLFVVSMAEKKKKA